MSVLYDKGVHITDIFEILSKQFEGREIESLFIIAKSKVSEGTKVSEALKAMNIFPDFTIEMVLAGEETREVEEMFSLVASICKKKTEKLIQKFLTLLEPATLLILALFVAFFVFATILPIFSLSIK